jgi:hypothetical protein
MYRVLVEKSAGEAGSAADYRDLMFADALHLVVEQNNVRPAGRTHGHLYGGQTGNAASGGEISASQSIRWWTISLAGEHRRWNPRAAPCQLHHPNLAHRWFCSLRTSSGVPRPGRLRYGVRKVAAMPHRRNVLDALCLIDQSAVDL